MPRADTQCSVSDKAQILLTDGAEINAVAVQSTEGITKHHANTLHIRCCQKGSGFKQAFALCFGTDGVIGLVFGEACQEWLHVRNFAERGCDLAERFQTVLETNARRAVDTGNKVIPLALTQRRGTILPYSDQLPGLGIHRIIEEILLLHIRKPQQPPATLQHNAAVQRLCSRKVVQFKVHTHYNSRYKKGYNIP